MAPVPPDSLPPPVSPDAAFPVAGQPQSELSTPESGEPAPSFVKLAMRNMVRKGGTSLQHFALTTLGLLAVLVGLAFLTR